MNYYSLKNPSLKYTFQDAVINGLAPDGGLYMPSSIPSLGNSFIANLNKLSQQEIAYTIAKNFVEPEIESQDLQNIITKSFDQELPLTQLEENIYALELFHGPTLAFKDVGARFMAQVLQHFAKSFTKKLTVLVATSGDTGGAVANGFHNVEGINVVILYPKDKVSHLQEKQLTTLGGNIHAVQVDGTFDDCQRMVKGAFQDKDLQRNKFLTSANSINMARLIPQSFYYFTTYSKLDTNENVTFSVPSGNFGNLTAGVLAKKMNLPISNFIAATNVNDIVPKYLASEIFNPQPSVQTLSNAMDVGNPSNFARLSALYNNDWSEISTAIKGASFTDAETKEIIQKIFQERNYILDPHSAIGYLGLKKHMAHHKNSVGVFLATAHPSKFIDVVESCIQQKVDLPESLLALSKKTGTYKSCSTSFVEFKELFLSID